MPAGTDIVTWSPRVGATGDDRYDPGNAMRIAAGTASGTFSDPPTITQVNAASGINQVIAEIRRRCWGTSPASYWITPGDLSGLAPSWCPTSGKYLYTTFNTLKSAVDSIRTTEGQSAFSWSEYPLASADRTVRAIVTELRKALATDQYILYRWLADHGGYYGLQATTSPYPTISTVYLRNNCAFGEAGSTKYRGYLFFRLPADWPTGLTGSLRCWYTRGAGVRTFELWRANTHLGALDTGDWGNLDNAEHSQANNAIAPTAGTRYKSLLSLTSALNGNTNYTFIAVHNEERTDTNPATSLDNIRWGTGGTGESEQPRLILYSP